MDIWKELEAEGVNRHLLAEVRSFRDAHGVAEEVRGRIPNPRFVYYGKDVWEAAAAAVLCGENLLLAVLYRILMRIDIPVGNTLPDMVVTILICMIVRNVLKSKK